MESKTPFWKNLLRRTALVLAVVILAGGILAFFAQGPVRETLFGSHAWKIVGNFMGEATTGGPLALVKAWFAPDNSAIPLSRDEEMTRYQLRLVARSLDNFFRSLLEQTQNLVDRSPVMQTLTGGHAIDPLQEVKEGMRQYLQDNLDVMEISLWGLDGQKMAGIRYKQAPEYTLAPQILNRLDNKDNVLLRHSASANLVLVSAVRNKGRVVGAVSQTLNPIFFTKILDFLGVNQKIFYLRNREGDLVVDNYGAYQHLGRKLDSASFTFYRKFTTAKESNLSLKIDNVDYDLGVILEKNNLAGHLLAFLALLACVYLSLLAVQTLSKHLAKLFRAWKDSRAGQTREERKTVLPADTEDALEAELARLRSRETPGGAGGPAAG